MERACGEMDGGKKYGDMPQSRCAFTKPTKPPGARQAPAAPKEPPAKPIAPQRAAPAASAPVLPSRAVRLTFTCHEIGDVRRLLVAAGTLSCVVTLEGD